MKRSGEGGSAKKPKPEPEEYASSSSGQDDSSSSSNKVNQVGAVVGVADAAERNESESKAGPSSPKPGTFSAPKNGSSASKQLTATGGKATESRPRPSKQSSKPARVVGEKEKGKAKPRGKGPKKAMQKLQYIRFKIEPRKVYENRVQAILEFQAGTVKEIKLAGRATTAPGRAFPYGVQLSRLNSFQIGKHLTQTKTLEYLKFTPNLKRLVICGVADTPAKIISNSREEEMTNVRMAHLKELTVAKGVTVTDEDLARLFAWMPNLTKLEMTLDDKQFGIVCGYWKKLVSVTVRGELTDKGVTGMGDLGEEKTDQETPKPTEVLRPNITDLKYLEEFGCLGNHLTKLSVHYGFLRLPRLQNMEVLVSNYHRWGKNAREALEEKEIELYAVRSGRRGCIPLNCPLRRGPSESDESSDASREWE